MVAKDLNVRENLTMENNHQADSNNTPITIFKSRRRYSLSITTLALLVAFVICTLVAVSLIIYNFGTCSQLEASTGEQVVCTTIRAKGQSTPRNNAVDEITTENDLSVNKYEKDVRLPRSIKPLTYNISLTPYLQEGNFTFEGEETIVIEILEDCYNITMHATELNISKSDLFVRRVLANNSVERGDGLRLRKQYLLDSKQFFVIESYDKLKKFYKYEITIKFNGLIQDYLQGFYRSSYYTANETRWLASTQFQATDARRAFPCFDEPALKANFTLHIARPSNMTTISNMPIVSTKGHETMSTYVWDHFAESVPMSTYLVAYAISDFSHLTDGIFSVYARRDAIHSAEYALIVGPNILRFLEGYFNMSFPLPKIDMIALPDFQAGAMENWGLITYRETTMLFEEHVSATTNKQRIASVIGHELAHQWFGNLVTPSWWSDIWLNEGFASYMEYLTVDAIEPDWKTMDQFVVNELQNVFHLDALSTSHKISVEVCNPDEISEIFDRISYGKGSTIIRMMSHFLTSDVFRRGLSKYLREMAYLSAEQDDLWRFLTAEAKAAGLLEKNITVKEIMDTWTLQMGFPVLTVTLNPHTQIIELDQTRFVYTKEATNSKQKNLWWIPISYTTNTEQDFETTRPVTWVPCTKHYEIENRNLSNADWYIFNIQQTGYYRTNYDARNWRALTEHLMKPIIHKQIGAANRAQLIDDAMNLARGGYIDYETALNLTRYLGHENDFVPWKAAITAFNFIDSMFVNQGDYDLLKNYLLKLLQNIYNEVDFDDEPSFKPPKKQDMLKILKRVEILNMACHLGHPHCISECSRQFQNWIEVPNPDANNPISPDLRGIIYCSAIQYGTEATWDFAFERYLKSTVSTEKELLLTALGCSKEPWILFRYLRRSVAGDSIRKQDVYRVFGAVSSNVVGQQIAFDFFRSNWEEIKAYLGSANTNLYMILKFSTKRMNSKFLLKELKSFVKDEMHDQGRSVKQIIEQVQVNLDWMNRNYKSIVEWLKRETILNAIVESNQPL